MPVPRLAAAAAALAAGFACSSALADSQVAERFESGVWKGSAHLDEGSGTFSHCATYAPYEGGQLVVLLRTRAGFSVGLADPEWRLEAGARYPFLMAIDARWTRNVTGEVASEHVVRVDFGDDPEVVNALRAGEALTVVGRDEVLRFALTDAGRALSDLEQCYLRHARAVERPGPPDRNPFVGEDPRVPDRLPAPRLSLAEFAGLVELAGLANGEGGIAGGALGFAHYYFVLPERLIALYWEEQSRGRHADATLQDSVDLWARECPGSVQTGLTAREDRPDVTLRQAFVSCERADGAGYVAVTVIDFGPVSQVLVIVAERGQQRAADALARRFYELELGEEPRSAARADAGPWRS
jgi:hypothetical protein